MMLYLINRMIFLVCGLTHCLLTNGFSGSMCSSQPDTAPLDALAGRNADAAAVELLILDCFKPGLAVWYGYSQHTGMAREAVLGSAGQSRGWERNVNPFVSYEIYLHE